jgi:ADP-ribose pyrophosphatase YjhB (NUDIX family)/adenosine deaminase
VAVLELPIDIARCFMLRLEGRRLSFVHDATERRSPLRHALRRHLWFRSGASTLTLPIDGSSVDLPLEATELSIQLGDAIQLAQVRLGPGTPALLARYQLSPLETRFLADNGRPHPPSPDGPLSLAPVTDLHTHFAGCLGARRLIELGLAHGVSYPLELLERAGIRDSGRGPEIPLAALPEAFLARLERRLALPMDRQVTFQALEEVYLLRAPITKSLPLFVPLCAAIADDYRRMGARWVDLSLGEALLEPERLQRLHAALAEIESQTGVALRFLVAMRRTDDLDWDRDIIARIKEVARSRIVAGVDFMGHETNSTRAFETQLREVAAWAHAERPGFVVRVHAGESAAHPENVRAVLDAASAFDVELRIGHGIHGVDDATLERLRQRGAIVEFNLSSNLALNNLQSCAEAPLLRYRQAGVPVVLGTDGYGIYLTSLALEVRAGRAAGLSPEDLAAIRQTEEAMIARRQEAEARSTDDPRTFRVPPPCAPRRWKPDDRARREKVLHAEALLARLGELGPAVLDRAGLDGLLRGRRCISFAGAWRHSWDALSEEDRRLAESVIVGFAERAPADTIIICGGTRFGVEGVVGRAARQRGLCVVGTIVEETPLDHLDADHLSHAFLIAEDSREKAASLYRIMREHDGLCVFIGGGDAVNDEVQIARNMQLRYLLLEGPAGASTVQARAQPEHAFVSAEQIVEALVAQALASQRSPYRHPGPNPTVDIVLLRVHPETGAREVLLIKRGADAQAEGERWALPGGFQATDARRDEPWTPGRETAEEACLRELEEEAGLDLRRHARRLVRLGVREGGGRDPRDSAERWSRAQPFALGLRADEPILPIAGGDDASDARWWPLRAMPPALAFDHAAILAEGLRALGILDQEPNWSISF